MGHTLHAVIGPHTVIEKLWLETNVIQLPQEFAMVPMTAALHDDIVELVDINKPDPYPDFERLSAGIAWLLEDRSRHGILAYIETDYFGGVGVQRAIAWQAGKIACGPILSGSSWEEQGLVVTPSGDTAINQVLTRIGVRTDRKHDPFDMLGLVRFRHTETAFNER